MTQNTLRFSYKIPASRIVMMVLAALAITAASAYIALTNSKSMRILGIALVPDQATLFFWGVTALCGLATLVALYMAIQSLNQLGYVELQERLATLPKASLHQRMLAVPYSAIRSIRVVQVPGSQQMLNVSTALGNCSLMSVGFDSPREFSAFCAALQERAGG